MPGSSKAEVVESWRIQSIQEAALRVISAKGLAAATMQEIADEAGVAKGTIYLYFKNREELCERTAETAFARLVAELEKALASPRPFAAMLGELVGRQIGFFHAHREFFRLYLALRYPEGGAEHRSRTHRYRHGLYARYLGWLAAFLRDAMKRGEIRRLDPDRLALLLSESVNAIVLRRLTETSGPPPEKDVEWLVATFLHGIVPAGGRR